MRHALRTLTIIAALAAGLASARAEVAEVRLSKQYGLPYLPFMVMEQFSLLEKQAEKHGLKLEVSWTTLSNATAMMEAILSGQMDFITPGVPTLATMWDKTVGTPNEIRALSARPAPPSRSSSAPAAPRSWPSSSISTRPITRTSARSSGTWPKP